MKEDNDSSWREYSAQNFKLQVLSLVTGEFQTVLLFGTCFSRLLRAVREGRSVIGSRVVSPLKGFCCQTRDGIRTRN